MKVISAQLNKIKKRNLLKSLLSLVSVAKSVILLKNGGKTLKRNQIISSIWLLCQVLTNRIKVSGDGTENSNLGKELQMTSKKLKEDM